MLLKCNIVMLHFSNITITMRFMLLDVHVCVPCVCTHVLHFLCLEMSVSACKCVFLRLSVCVCVYVYVCVRACVPCMCVFARAVCVCELQAAWHMRTDQLQQLVRQACYYSSMIIKGPLCRIGHFFLFHLRRCYNPRL